VLQGTPGAKQRAEAENQQAGIKASSVEGRPRSEAAGRDQKTNVQALKPAVVKVSPGATRLQGPKINVQA
jgi:hypothetical protein